MTLIELLVVISIMMLLAIMTIPSLRPAMEERRIREAARAIHVFFSAAQTRAVLAGRSFGVELERDPNLVLGCRTLYQVEVPAPYAGEMSNSVMNFANPTPSGANAFTAEIQFYSPGPVYENPMAFGFARAGDELRVNLMGEYWTITNIVAQGSPNTWLFTFYRPSGVAIPSAAAAVPYQIRRQPVRTQYPPLQLPRSVVVDLTYSGAQNLFWPYNNTDQRPVVILFNSRRAVDRYCATDAASGYYMPFRPLSPIFLLVGRRERVNPDVTDLVTYTEQGVAIPQPQPVADDGRTNLADLENLWVTINSQTGYVACAEMADGLTTDDDGDAFYYLPLSRQFAREFQSMGGR